MRDIVCHSHFDNQSPWRPTKQYTSHYVASHVSVEQMMIGSGDLQFGSVGSAIGSILYSVVRKAVIDWDGLGSQVPDPRRFGCVVWMDRRDRGRRVGTPFGHVTIICTVNMCVCDNDDAR